MIKIAFLGSDSTHANAFANLVNFEKGPFYKQARIVSIWGTDLLETKAKADSLAIPKVSDTPEEALEGVDLAMVIGRFGNAHIQPATVALRKGIPTFIDKPFTSGTADAREIIRLAESGKVPFFSSSPLRFAPEVLAIKNELKNSTDFKELFIACPKNCIELGDDPRFESPFFYGIHVVEIALEILGFKLKSHDYFTNEQQTTIFLDHEAYSSTIHMVKDMLEFYSLTFMSTTGIKRYDIQLDGSYYTNLLRYILTNFMVKGEVIPAESSLMAVSILEKIEQHVR